MHKMQQNTSKIYIEMNEFIQCFNICFNGELA